MTEKTFWYSWNFYFQTLYFARKPRTTSLCQHHELLSNLYGLFWFYFLNYGLIQPSFSFIFVLFSFQLQFDSTSNSSVLGLRPQTAIQIEKSIDGGIGYANPGLRTVGWCRQNHWAMAATHYRLIFFNGPTPASFCFFLVFQANITIFQQINVKNAKSIQYTAPGFELTTSQLWIVSHNH